MVDKVSKSYETSAIAGSYCKFFAVSTTIDYREARGKIGNIASRLNNQQKRAEATKHVVSLLRDGQPAKIHLRFISTHQPMINYTIARSIRIHFLSDARVALTHVEWTQIRNLRELI